MSRAAVLHVNSLLGGGVDRHLRDIASGVDGPQLFWHAGADADVVEIPAQRRFVAIDRGLTLADPHAVPAALRALRVGLVHLHASARPARAAARRIASALRVPLLVTLHDVLFLRPDAFDSGAPIEPDPAWLGEVAPVLRSAAAVLAPSEYVATLARRHIAGLEVEVVPNGSAPAAAPERTPRARAMFLRERPDHVAAVVGAIGPHKGADLIEQLATALEGTGIALVVIGYLDRQLHPGWRVPGRLFVHGAFADAELPGLLRAYGAEIALFANRAPESFCYALSDVWTAGLPALAMPAGALAERIGRHGGGWLLPADADARAVAARLRELLEGERRDELARVKSILAHPDPARVPALETMSRSLDAFYQRFAIDPQSPATASPAALDRLAATNIDGSMFRQELVRLADEYAQALEALERVRSEAHRNEADARAWISKLEGDIRDLTGEVEKEVAERRRLGQEVAQLQAHREALELLPGLVRRLLLKKVHHARR
jgi:glycosyltransferase involved in cell wall biosynthesis